MLCVSCGIPYCVGANGIPYCLYSSGIPYCAFARSKSGSLLQSTACSHANPQNDDVIRFPIKLSTAVTY